MIAYSHLIKFTPPLSTDKKASGTYTNAITVQQCIPNDLSIELSYKTTFTNNQGRDLALYSDRKFHASRKDQLWAFEVEGVLTFYWQHGSLST